VCSSDLNGYGWIVRKNGQPSELINLLPDRTRLVTVKGAGLRYEVSNLDKDGGVKFIEPSSIIHIRGISFDGTVGAELVKHARDVWGQALAKQGYVSKFFRKGGRKGGTLEVPMGASPAFADTLESGFRKTYEDPDAWFKTVVLRDGAKFHAASDSLRDSQMVESSEASVREVGRFFNLSPSRLGLSDSVSYNSKAEDNRAYLDSTLAPWLEEIVSQCWMRLLSIGERQRDSHYFEHNTRALLAMSYKERVTTGAIGIRAKLITRDEWRKGENLGPHPDGDGDSSDGMESVTPDGGADKGENDQPRGPADDEGRSADRMNTIRRVFDVAASARRKAKDHRAFFEWLQSGLKRHLADNPGELLTQFVGELQTCENLSVGELRKSVDRLTSEFERRVCNDN